ncbi:MAG: hypothetical protein ACXW2V_08550, partial [Candidatus Aminicenantales bacterium]
MRRDGRRNIFTVVLALAAISVPVLVGAAGSGRPGSSRQTKSQASGAAIKHEVTVTLKLIQVFVTDARGKAAMDLNKSDFALYDNGALQAITDFESHVLAIAAAGRAEPAPSPVLSSKTAAPLLNRKFFFIIDYLRNDL